MFDIMKIDKNLKGIKCMIDENRLKHIYAVAKLMEENAEKHGLDKQEMFMLGFLHDIGYEFGGSEEHHVVGAAMLEKENYKYLCDNFCLC